MPLPPGGVGLGPPGGVGIGMDNWIDGCQCVSTTVKNGVIH